MKKGKQKPTILEHCPKTLDSQIKDHKHLLGKEVF